MITPQIVKTIQRIATALEGIYEELQIMNGRKPDRVGDIIEKIKRDGIKGQEHHVS